MEQLRALFYATGEGLPKDTIDQSLARVYSLLDIMRMDTGTLIARYQVTTAPPCCAWWFGLPAVLGALVAMIFMLTHVKWTDSADCASRLCQPTQAPWARGRCC